MGTNFDDELNDSLHKSYKKKIENIFKFGSNSNRSEQKSKTKSKSLRSKWKSFWRRQKSDNKDECKWLLDQSTSQIYSGINDFESERKDEKNIRKKKNKEKVKEMKEKPKKNKSLVKKVGKITLQTCRYMSMGSAPGYAFNPTAHYNYETHSYEYYSYAYGDPQSYSPSMFF